jgi:hypothetical protein
MLANAGKYGVLGQIISKIVRRDLAPTNALSQSRRTVRKKESHILHMPIGLTMALGTLSEAMVFKSLISPDISYP